MTCGSGSEGGGFGPKKRDGCVRGKVLQKEGADLATSDGKDGIQRGKRRGKEDEKDRTATRMPLNDSNVSTGWKMENER